MNISQLMSRMNNLGIRLWAEGERLRFDAPAGVFTDELREQIIQHKAEIFQLLNKAEAVEKSRLPPLNAYPGTDNIPLSFAQQRLWLAEQISENHSPYNIVRMYRLHGKLDIDALQAALNYIVRRHEILRTSIELKGEQPVQNIKAELKAPFTVDDLRHLSSVNRESEVARISAGEYLRSFDLMNGPLLSTLVLQLGEEEHVLLLTFHHIICDGWSLGVIFRELSRCYAAYSDGQKPELAALPVNYADFSRWQRDWLSGDVLQKQVNFWREFLDDYAVVDFPTDHSRPNTQSFRGASESMMLVAEHQQKLQNYSEQQAVTLYMTLLTVYAILMHRYSSQNDIVLGTPIANRNLKKIENLVGFFVNSLVLRIDVSGEPNFSELLKRVKAMTLSVYQHQDLPFEKLVDELKPVRDLSRNPLFQHLFALQNAPVSEFTAESLRVETVQPKLQLTRFDLEMHHFIEAKGLKVVAVYSTDLFDAKTIQQMLKHYRNLLVSAIDNADMPVGRLTMLDVDEKYQLLEQWSHTATDEAVVNDIDEREMFKI